MQQFWAQILTYYEAGEIWWLQQEDEEVLNSYNESHLKTCPYTELLTDRYIFPVVEDEETDEWLGATAIYQQLDMKANEVVGAREVARVLKNLGVRYRRNNKRFLVRDNPDYEEPKKPSLFADDDKVTEVTNELPKNEEMSNSLNASA